MSAPAAVRVITDSTACLPDDAARAAGVMIVPLRVVAGEEEWREGVEISPDEVADRIAAGERLTTSQPPPADFLTAYRSVAAGGARSIVSVHISGELSGTVGAAEHAAHRAMLPVRVVDSRTVAMALGFAALEAARCAAAGYDTAHVATRAAEVAHSSRTVFLVDSLDHLRRGGRLSAPAAALGTALGVRPILGVSEQGRIELLQRVRTRAVATERLVARAVRHADDLERPGLAVHHLGAPERAEALAETLRARVGADVVVTPVSAVLGAHAGPGALAVASVELGRHQH